MSSEEFITFQKFNDQIAAMDLGAILHEGNIDYELENASPSFDASFANNELSKEFRIKIRKQDFEKANGLIKQISLSQLDSVDKDYYLFDFTDEELMEIISKPDEWGQFNFLLAQKILKARGKEIKPEEVEELNEQRLEELAKPEGEQEGWIIAGYIMSFLGGLLGVFYGWHLLTHKRTLPNGKSVYAYSQSDRKHGNRIFLIGIFFSLFWILIKIVASMD